MWCCLEPDRCRERGGLLRPAPTRVQVGGYFPPFGFPVLPPVFPPLLPPLGCFGFWGFCVGWLVLGGGFIHRPPRPHEVPLRPLPAFDLSRASRVLRCIR